MTIATLLLATLLGVVAGCLIAWSLLGRPLPAIPRCGDCGADARAAALGSRRCGCGADLAAPCAIRLDGWRSSRGLLALGIVLALTLLAGLWIGIANARLRLQWVDRLPVPILNIGLGSAATWARESLLRRLDAGLVTEASAQSITEAMVRAYESRQAGLLPPPACADLAFLLPPDSPLVATMVRACFSGTVGLVNPDPVLPEERVTFKVVSGKVANAADAFQWVESVTVDGSEVEWARVRPSDGEGLPMTRFLESNGHIALTLPPGLAPGEHRVTVRMAIGWTDLPVRRIQRAAIAAGSEGPESWGVGVRYRMIESTTTVSVVRSKS